MRAAVQAVTRQQYRHYVSTYARETIGAQEWNGVCATCHGNLGQGGYGPAIANNSLLTQTAGLTGILRNGFTGSAGAMPPVGDTWNNQQISALVAYVKKHIYKSAPLGATGGG
jgi:mono/diheme cytochrome c family protein